MQRWYCIVVLMLAVLSGVACSHAPRVRAGLDAVLADPGLYQDCELIVTADIADVLERYHLYREQWIEVTGVPVYYGRRSFWTWYIMLADGQQQLRCYTHHYRISIGRDAESVMLRAFHAQKPLTVNGFLRTDGIDIREIIFEDQIVRPDYKPPVVPLYPWIL